MAYYSSDFYCTQCGNKGIPVQRKIGQDRSPGHLKRLFCLQCREETNHAEIRPFGAYTLDDFREEFELGRFVDGNIYPVNQLLGCSKRDCKYNKNGRCWNSNNSANCEHRKGL